MVTGIPYVDVSTSYTWGTGRSVTICHHGGFLRFSHLIFNPPGKASPALRSKTPRRCSRDTEARVTIGFQFSFCCHQVRPNYLKSLKRMGGRVVEGTGLENRQARKRLVGSNPTPSANLSYKCLIYCIIGWLPSIKPLPYPQLFTCQK